MRIRFFLLIIIITSTITANAQLAKGHYSFINKTPVNQQSSVFDDIVYEDCSSLPTGLGKRFFCAALDVFDDNKILLYINKSFDTGNTIHINSGNYLVGLKPTGKNTYSGKNELIELTLEVIENNELKIFVRKRVENINIKGIASRFENIVLFENTEYFFKHKSNVPQNLVSGLTMSSIEKLGINYGSYKFMKDHIIWEDITKRKPGIWEDITGPTSKEGLKKVDNADVTTFEVCTHCYNNFYLILVTSQQSFSKEYTDYAKDKKRVYYQGEVMKRVSPSDFWIIDPLYAKTSKNVFYKNVLIPNADVGTFESINGGYAMDKNNYYNKGLVVPKDEIVKKLLQDKKKSQF